MNKVSFDSLQLVAGDVSQNGQVMAFDAALVLKYTVGYLLHFPSGDTLYSFDVNALPRVAPVSNSEVKILASMLTKDENIVIPITLKDINQVYSANIELNYNSDLVEFVGYKKTDLTKNFYVLTNDEEGVLNVAMASPNAMVDDGKIIVLEFRQKAGGSGEIEITRFVLNEEVFDVSIGAGASNLPKKFSLHQNYPNPFNPVTMIKFDLPKSADVVLKIYNILGQEVRTLINKRMPAGYHSVMWDSRNNEGRLVSSGVYLYRLKAGDFVVTKKMILVR